MGGLVGGRVGGLVGAGVRRTEIRVVALHNALQLSYPSNKVDKMSMNI